MDALYNNYKNIEIFMVKYRKFVLKSKFIDVFDAFVDQIRIDGFIKQQATDPKQNNKLIWVYLFAEDSKYCKSITPFKTLLSNIPTKNNMDLLIISYMPIIHYISKVKTMFPHITIKNYLQMFFHVELPLAAFCSPHVILTPDEIKNLLDDIKQPIDSLPKIYDNDPQIIWCGAIPGDVVEIKNINELTGYSLHFRFVIPFDESYYDTLVVPDQADIAD